MALLKAFLEFVLSLFSVEPKKEKRKMLGTPNFKRSIQTDDYTCGPRSAYMIAQHHGIDVSFKEVKRLLKTTEEGTNVKPLLEFFRKRGLRTRYQPTMSFKELKYWLGEGGVVLVHVDGDHLAVVHAVSKEYVYMADPSIIRMPGRRITKEIFKRRWTNWGVVVRPASPSRPSRATARA